MTFVVIVQRTELQRDVYGPYRGFKRAEGDAKAWGGTVEPIQSRAAPLRPRTPVMDAIVKAIHGSNEFKFENAAKAVSAAMEKSPRGWDDWDTIEQERDMDWSQSEDDTPHE